MGTVGLSFGSATSGSGFDVATTVTSILALSQTIETPWKSQLATINTQNTAFTTIGTHLSTLSTSLQALTDFEGVMAEKLGSSSNPDALALTSAGPTATAGSHSVIVSQLAQTSSVYTSAAPAADLLSGSMTVQVGTGAVQTITVGSANVTIQSGTGTPQVIAGASNTLSSLAAAINAAGIGVQASLISDTTGTRLSLVSATSGSAGQLTVTSGLSDASVATPAPLTMQTGLLGQDAMMSVDGNTGCDGPGAGGFDCAGAGGDHQ
jgi:flagellar hook-associated protein 2